MYAHIRDHTADAYEELDRAETDLRAATELLVAPGPVEDRDQADAIRGWFDARDAHRNAEVEVVTWTNLLGVECSDVGLDLAEVIGDFTDRLLIDCASEVRAVPVHWPPRAGDVWMTRRGWMWVLRGGEMVAEDAGGERVPVGGFRDDDPVLVTRAGGAFL